MTLHCACTDLYFISKRHIKYHVVVKDEQQCSSRHLCNARVWDPFFSVSSLLTKISSHVKDISLSSVLQHLQKGFPQILDLSAAKSDMSEKKVPAPGSPLPKILGTPPNALQPYRLRGQSSGKLNRTILQMLCWRLSLHCTSTLHLLKSQPSSELSLQWTHLHFSLKRLPTHVACSY